MKYQNAFKTFAVVMGFAAISILAGSARAQEIENTRWDDGPNVVPYEQPAPSGVEDTYGTAAAAVPARESSAPVVKKIAAQQASVAEWDIAENWVFSSLLVFTAVIALYALAEAKRATRNLGARNGAGGNYTTAAS